MKIVTCAKCGKEIHRAERCCYCGGTDFLPTGHQVWVHENVETEYDLLEELLRQKEFSQVVDLTHIVLAWTPRCAEAYWMRLLARNGCTDDRQLILLGVDLENDGDYFNATRYGDDLENRVYETVCSYRDDLEGKLIETMENHYREKRRALDLPGCRDALVRLVEGEQDRIMNLCARLWELELEISHLDQMVRLAAEPQREAVTLAKRRLEEIRRDINQMKTWNEITYQKIQIRLGEALELYGQSAAVLEQMSQDHPWGERYRELLKEKKRIRNDLTDYRKKLEAAQQKGAKAVEQFRALEKEEDELFDSAYSGFIWVREALGERIFRDTVKLTGMEW